MYYRFGFDVTDRFVVAKTAFGSGWRGTSLTDMGASNSIDFYRWDDRALAPTATLMVLIY